MARIDELLQQVDDAALRAQLADSLEDLRSRKKFGLVFEEHIPEVSGIPGIPPYVGCLAQLAADPTHPLVRVRERIGGEFGVEFVHGGSTLRVSQEDLVVVKRFGEAIFPALTHLGSVVRGEDIGRPHHLVLNGENYHALQLLLYLYERQVDCIYIDPPYNTGAKDWKYNNDYVDEQDSWRHSKWLSMMEKRLRIAGRLLKEDSVLIVTIDEHEVHHLAMLLEQLFPKALVQMVTIVINPAGVAQAGFARVEEYALYCFFGEAQVSEIDDDYLSDTSTLRNTRLWHGLPRTGVGGSPSDTPNLVFPIGLDPETGHIRGFGRSLKERIEAGECSDDKKELDNWEPDPSEDVNGHLAVWPRRSDGRLGRWRVKAETLAELVNKGYVRAQRNGATWALSYVISGAQKRIHSGEVVIVGRDGADGPVILEQVTRQTRPKTVWKRSSHNAGWHGSVLLKELIGKRNFDYPKSVYAVRDALLPVVQQKPDALVVDFFAGSGTTLHATMLLNRRDAGRRRCVLVTNNEIPPADEKQLRSDGVHPLSQEWRSLGIFEAVTRPRIEAAIAGKRRDGETLSGKYDDDVAWSDGFNEKADFFCLTYLDPDQVELGKQFDAVHPALWAAAGSIGPCPVQPIEDSDFVMPPTSTYAVLLRDSRFKDFLEAVHKRPDLTHVWLVTNSESDFADMRELLPADLEVSMLYRDYLRNFEINTAERLR